ncbi:MAG: CBS domain-containing protein [Crenarchaeota archaeon]|nr:MAG: CBS domain-containing protein [Thermoproteota archaeon]RDJ33491.1 MAG: CBS domain-containing protein [Thermoproteota archaeon]RDJ36060.1 MAG: CBS domain-containing protein [Thermoproteota archaeon]RDJ38191.1 MAG: CBS domain-containing protein [Thermoproteota archaeon]
MQQNQIGMTPQIKAHSLSHKPISLPQNSTIYDVMKKMYEKNISRLLLTHRNQFTGIVTQKDIGKFLLAQKNNSPISKTPVSKIMNSIVYVDENASAIECSELMLKHQISSLVVKKDNKFRIFTKNDLTKYYAQNCNGKFKVFELMTIGQFFCKQTSSIMDVLSNMISYNASRLIVKDDDEVPVGIITFRNFINIALEFSQKEKGPKHVVNNFDNFFASKNGYGRRCLANEIMTRDIIVVNAWDDLTKAAQIILDNRVHGIGVVSKGEIIGIISEKDIIRALTMDSQED